ncbi:sugar ABC transporter ATP-binding protein [Dickeya fangzhongdai]|uniref:ABC transporter ATP-binding protein n=1 Tax=Dickeya fangzhongdai TaxID=1778540 RepID=UPI000EB3E530|nr:ABC transporter ATP-binding protein [Dickeya fangzhongdai]AYH50043.1 sugar ABC transporter ATP-binding protein [Dickeya fangzhongdai]WES90116.1 ABC transporter ATP-binding protein [Dickeya fangzhongdai]
MAEIVLDGVTKAWGDTPVLHPVNLTLADGEFVAILGPSGCGKSTTLFLLAGLYAPTQGHILFDGQRVNGVDARDRNVGVVFQSYALYPHLNVYDNIAFPLRFKPAERDERDQRVRDAAALVQVTELLDRKPAALSGGQQQRVALARALVKRPSLLLLDEPLSNLDATLRMTMRTELKAIHARSRATTLMVTHDQLEAMTLASRIICMNQGRVEQIGTPQQLYRQPANTFVAGFIGSPPICLLPGQASGYQLTVGETRWGLSSTYHGALTLGIRPEDVALTPPGAGLLSGRIEHVEPMGREILYRLHTPLGPLQALAAGSTAQYDVGMSVGVSLSVDALLLFDADGNRLPDAGVVLPANTVFACRTAG